VLSKPSNVTFTLISAVKISLDVLGPCDEYCIALFEDIGLKSIALGVYK